MYQPFRMCFILTIFYLIKEFRLINHIQNIMQYLSAYALASISEQKPSFQTIKNILQATKKPYDQDKIHSVIQSLSKKPIHQFIQPGLLNMGTKPMLFKGTGKSHTIKKNKKMNMNIYDENFLDKLDECGERAEYHNLVDVLFVIDTTGSMSWCVRRLKDTIYSIISNFADKQYNIKFALCIYRDHPPQENTYVEKHFDLMSAKKIIDIINTECSVGGGGDTPEAVFDGLVSGLKNTSWRTSIDGKTKSKRFIFHGCDAPPHGKQYGQRSSDKAWSENGCPCGLKIQDVDRLLKDNIVDYSLIKCGRTADKMAEIFQGSFKDKFKRVIEINQGGSYSDYEQQDEQCMGGLFGDDDGMVYKKQYKAEKMYKAAKDVDMAEEIVEEMQCGLFGFFD